MGPARSNGSGLKTKEPQPKGASTVHKVGTKARNVSRAAGDHGIDFKVDSIGAMQLKSGFVRKA